MNCCEKSIINDCTTPNKLMYKFMHEKYQSWCKPHA